MTACMGILPEANVSAVTGEEGEVIDGVLNPDLQASELIAATGVASVSVHGEVALQLDLVKNEIEKVYVLYRYLNAHVTDKLCSAGDGIGVSKSLSAADVSSKKLILSDAVDAGTGLMGNVVSYGVCSNDGSTETLELVIEGIMLPDLMAPKNYGMAQSKSNDFTITGPKDVSDFKYIRFYRMPDPKVAGVPPMPEDVDSAAAELVEEIEVDGNMPSSWVDPEASKLSGTYIYNMVAVDGAGNENWKETSASMTFLGGGGLGGGGKGGK